MLELPLGEQPRLAPDIGGIAASCFPARYQGTHCNPFWVLNILDGSGDVHLDGERIRFGPGWAILAPPGSQHRWCTTAMVPITFAHFHASGDAVGIPAAQDLGPRAHGLRSLLLDAARRTVSEPERATVALWHALWELSATPLRVEEPVHHPLVRAALATLADPAGLNPRSTDLSHKLGVSPRHLNRLWVAAFGLPLGSWLRRRRLQQARQLLAHTTLPVRRIAAMTGYADLQHFNKAMRRFAGCSPRALR